jgi:hypothetical protein
MECRKSERPLILTIQQQRLADSIQANAERLGLPDLTIAAITREARDHFAAFSADRRWASLTCEWLHDDCERLTPPELRFAAAVMGTARSYGLKAELIVLAAIHISLLDLHAA